jgi:flagellar biosynthesis protein FlhB
MRKISQFSERSMKKKKKNKTTKQKKKKKKKKGKENKCKEFKTLISMHNFFLVKLSSNALEGILDRHIIF